MLSYSCAKEVVFVGRFFAPDFGDLEITAFFADNEIYCREVRFSIPIEKWSEFESSPMYRELTDYVHALEIPERLPRHHGGGLEWEIDGSSLHSRSPAPRESFWARARKWFRGNGSHGPQAGGKNRFES